jgi:hypothetical protein
MTNPRTLVTHTYPCGHTQRITQRNATKNTPRCWDCERPFHEQRKLAERRARRQATRRPPTPATTEQRQAQRKLVATLNCRLIIAPDGLYIQRGATEPYEDHVDLTGEVTQWLEVLDIPCSVYVQTVKRKKRFTVMVAWTDLPALAEWAPAAAHKAETSYLNAVANR